MKLKIILLNSIFIGGFWCERKINIYRVFWCVRSLLKCFYYWFKFQKPKRFTSFHTKQYTFRQYVMFLKEFVFKVMTRCTWWYHSGEVIRRNLSKIFSRDFNVTETVEPVPTATRACITLTADQNKIFAKYVWKDHFWKMWTKLTFPSWNTWRLIYAQFDPFTFDIWIRLTCQKHMLSDGWPSLEGR